MAKQSLVEKLLKDKDKTQEFISKLYAQATESEIALLKSIGKAPLRLYKPYPKQELFHKDKTHIRLVTGGNSSGKTWVGCAEFISRLEKVHPYDFEWNNKKIPRHGMVLVEDFEQCIQHGASQTKILSMIDESKLAKHGLTFKDGVLTDVLYLDGSSFRVRSSRAGRKSLQGSRLDLIWVDEDCIKDENMYDELIFRLSDSGLMPLILYTYTPNLEVIKDSFADSVLIPRSEDTDKKYDLSLHQFSLYDNPYIPEETKLKLLRNSAGGVDQQNARFDGESKRQHGLIYAFRKEKHIIPPISRDYIKGHCKAIFRVIDSHPVKPIAVSFIGCFDDGRVIQFEELFNQGLVKDVAERIRKVCDGLGHLIKRSIFDYSGNAPQKITGKSVADEFRDCGIAVVNCNKDVTLGINYVREMLMFDTDTDPTLFITSNCTNTIREFSKYRENPVTGEPIKKNDEFMDNLRYFACDLDAQFYFLKRSKKNVRKGQIIINESTIINSDNDTERIRRIKEKRNRQIALVGRGTGRRG